MKRRQVWRYSCDFCKKSNCSKFHIGRHEQACTANPDRLCRMCGFNPIYGNSMQKLVDAANKCTEEDLRPLREVTSCPACMLAAIRQCGKQRPWAGEDDYGFSFAFDFKKEKADWWANENEAREPQY